MEATKKLKKFGITMGVALLILCGISFLKHKAINNTLVIISGVFFFTGFVFPRALNPVYITWMKMGHVLGWINTRIILVIIFYLIFTPMGVVLRLFGKDFLERKIEPAKDSYWQNAPILVREHFERQF